MTKIETDGVACSSAQSQLTSLFVSIITFLNIAISKYDRTDDCTSILLILMIIQALSSRDLKYPIIVIFDNVDLTPASLPTTYSVSQNIFEWLKSFRLCSLSKIFEALATISADAGWLHVRDGGLCGPDPRMCQLWQPLFGDLRARGRLQKKGHKGQNLGHFCLLRMVDLYRFLGPGL